MALGSTQPLTEISTRSISWGKGGRCVRLTTLPPSCAVVTKSGSLKFLEPSGPVQVCKGTALSFFTVSEIRRLKISVSSQWHMNADSDCKICTLTLSVTRRWGKFSQKHNYEYMAKWWCSLAIENYMFRPMVSIISFWQFFSLRVIYNMHKPRADVEISSSFYVLVKLTLHLTKRQDPQPLPINPFTQ